MYHADRSTFRKNASTWAAARVSDQIGMDSRSGSPAASTGTTARLWPERARHATSARFARLAARRSRVAFTTAFHQSAGRCSCHPESG